MAPEVLHATFSMEANIPDAQVEATSSAAAVAKSATHSSAATVSKAMPPLPPPVCASAVVMP